MERKIDARTPREIKRDKIKNEIKSRYLNMVKLLSDPNKPQRVFPLIARELGVSENYVRMVLTRSGLYVPRTKK